MLPWQCYVQEAYGRKDAKNGHKIMVFAPCCPKSSPNPLPEFTIYTAALEGFLLEKKFRGDNR